MQTLLNYEIPTCRALLQLSALCQRTYRVSDTIQCLFQLLDEKLPSLEMGLQGNPLVTCSCCSGWYCSSLTSWPRCLDTTSQTSPKTCQTCLFLYLPCLHLYPRKRQQVLNSVCPTYCSNQ